MTKKEIAERIRDLSKKILELEKDIEISEDAELIKEIDKELELLYIELEDNIEEVNL